MNKLMRFILFMLVAAACLYFIFNSLWFEIGDACPEGQQRVVTVWNAGQIDERVGTMCVMEEGDSYGHH